ncbi:hypothetical protein [Rhizobium ruizarguesonis]|uniref:hypothetical protein n=1 Tax=Rhizobium ruizarguesonis TaxID=2081791 RepID=UPI00102F59B3|nr:hypothetical protein [Rhizobium ruizarguesonis]TAT71066.1 hypothetical protein ELI52_36490 [Rhizobium ruizarguesonis]
MIRKTSLGGAALFICVTGAPLHISAQDEANVAWSNEVIVDNDCSKLVIDWPTSLVPIEDSEASTGGSSWYSFDRRYSLSFETKATYYDTPQMSRTQYQNFVSCDPRVSTFGLDGKRNCAKSSTKMVVDAEGESGVCSRVVLIAPDAVSDRSRFLADIQLCSDQKSDGDFLRKSAMRMATSAQFTYEGCCRMNQNWIGCKSH